MNIPIEKESATQRLKRKKSSKAQTNDEINISMKDPDAVLSMVVLLLACLALAALANVFV